MFDLPEVRTVPETGRRRVLFLNLNWIVGGQEVVMLDLLRRLDQTRYEPFVVSSAEGLLTRTLRAEGIPTYLLPPHRLRKPLAVARAIAHLTQVLARERIDLVHCNGDSLLFYGALAAAPLGIPCVWHVYEPVATGGNAYIRFLYLSQRRLRPAFTIFGTAAVEESYLRDYPRLGPHASIMPGVDVDALAHDADAARARAVLGVPPDVPLLLVIARLQRSKGQRELLEALARLSGDFPAPHVAFCGGAPVQTDEDYPGELERLVVELGLTGRVHFAGQTSDALKRDLLAAATLLVHPAHREAFGIVVLEGMAAGKPVVVTDAVGPASILAGSDAGLVVPARDVAALREALRRILTDPETARRMGERGRAHVRARYSSEGMVRRVESVYDAVLSERRTRPATLVARAASAVSARIPLGTKWIKTALSSQKSMPKGPMKGA